MQATIVNNYIYNIYFHVMCSYLVALIHKITVKTT